MRRFLLYLTAALFISAAVFVFFTLPPKATQLTGAMPPNVVLGGYHIHSTRSDGTGTIDEIAAAAERAGLGFVVMTDHGDATRAPDRPKYLHGVLCIDAVEIGTLAGHLVALNLSTASPYPLAGEAADVIDDVHRMGGTAIAAHPDSPKDSLKWRASQARFDGLEWLNADSEWRDESNTRLVATIARYVFRPAEATASLFTRPSASLNRWDAASASRPVFGIAALDAHGGLMSEDVTDRRRLVAWPTYQALFRALAQAVVLDGPLSRTDASAVADASRVLTAIARGRSFSIVRANATPASLSFSASSGDTVAHMGDRLEPAAGSTVSFRAAVPQAASAHLVLFRNGSEVASSDGSVTFAGNAPAGAYRIAVFLGATAMPWIVSNPIYIGPLSAAPTPNPPPASPHSVALPVDAWGIEKDATSTWETHTEGAGTRWDFALGGGVPAGRSSAIVSSVDDTVALDRVRFTARSSGPMRLSIQVRMPTGDRWRRSVYLDETTRVFDVPLQEFSPVAPATSAAPAFAHVRGVLLVVDTLNTAPGTHGTVWISGVSAGTR